jgi:phosphoribosylamine--glycine ligase / phosphoribosylformylglycinamidine cyclo-ligase
MNILIIGSGGREHAICKKLSTSKCHLFYYGTHDNPGISKLAKLIGIGPLIDCDQIIKLALENNIDMTFIGPELPLSVGLADRLIKNNVHVIGPQEELAQIETSKYFARKLMMENNLMKYCPKILATLQPFVNYSKSMITSWIDNFEIVIKPDGLHGGKGVKVQGDHFNSISEGIDYCFNVLKKETVVIEEKLKGQEFSLMSFSDGYHVKHMIPVKDYKRVYEGDTGPNCGSMGSVTDRNGKLWFLSDSDIKECQEINEKIIQVLREKTGKLYKGILYGSFMKTTDKLIKVIEFNARFGDPECINILHLLENDLLSIFQAIIDGTLHQINLKFKPDASIFKYLVPHGYPDHPQKCNLSLQEIEKNLEMQSEMIYANIICENNQYWTLGSRILGIIHLDSDLHSGSKKVNEVMNMFLGLGNVFYRKDIGFDLSLSYYKSGVNIEEGNKAISEIKNDVESTFNSHVLNQFGDFSGIMKTNDGSILVASTDGVGTKSILILENYEPEIGFQMLGHDLVNLNVNDILVKGASPLFLLDYFGSSKIRSPYLKYFIKGVTEACKKVNCVLLGGETAEMQDIYQENKYDLVGMVVGTVKENEIINGKSNIQKNDLVIGLPSYGPHSNGYTLIRKMIQRLSSYQNIDQIIMEQLCASHKCYYDEMNQFKSRGVKIHGAVHISGGGFIDNPLRVLPDDLEIEYDDFELNPIFQFIQEKGVLSDFEMKRTFNCGYGFLVMIHPHDLEKMKGMNYKVLGTVIKKSPV